MELRKCMYSDLNGGKYNIVTKKTRVNFQKMNDKNMKKFIILMQIPLLQCFTFPMARECTQDQVQQQFS